LAIAHKSLADLFANFAQSIWAPATRPFALLFWAPLVDIHAGFNIQ
jgi:hypothetical protein